MKPAVSLKRKKDESFTLKTDYSKCLICQTITDEHGPLHKLTITDFSTFRDAVETRKDNVYARLWKDLQLRDKFLEREPQYHKNCSDYTDKKNLEAKRPRTGTESTGEISGNSLQTDQAKKPSTMDGVHKAASLLRDLVDGTAKFSYKKNCIRKVEDLKRSLEGGQVSSCATLLELLEKYESFVRDYCKTSDWTEGPRDLWLVMVNSKIMTPSVTRFLVCLDTLLLNTKDETFKDGSAISTETYKYLFEPDHENRLYKELSTNPQFLLTHYGYDSFDEYSKKLEEAIEIIKTVADDLDTIANAHAVINIVNSAATVSAGIMGIAGLILAPFTGGASLSLVAFSGTVEMGTTAISFTTLGIISLLDKETMNRFQQKIPSISELTMNLVKVCEQYSELIKELDPDADTKDLQNIMSKESDKIKKASAASSKSVAEKISIRVAKKESMRVAARAEAAARIVKRATAKAVVVRGTATAVTKVTAKTTVRAFTKAASAGTKSIKNVKAVTASMGAIASLMTLGFGTQDLISNVKALGTGSEVAKELRKIAEDLTAFKNSIKEAYY